MKCMDAVVAGIVIACHWFAYADCEIYDGVVWTYSIVNGKAHIYGMTSPAPIGVSPEEDTSFELVYENLKGATHSNPTKYDEGTEVSFSPPSAIHGYSFIGWTPTMITADMTGSQTIYANWTANSYGIGYELSGGVIDAIAPDSIIYDVWTSVPAPTRASYKFIGWDVKGCDISTAMYSIDGGVAVSMSDSPIMVPVEDDAVSFYGLVPLDGDSITLAAKWLLLDIPVVDVGNKGTVDTSVDGKYIVTANEGSTLTQGDIVVTALLNGVQVYTTKGYNVVISADGMSAIIALKTPVIDIAATDNDEVVKDHSDLSGVLVEVPESEIAAKPKAKEGEFVGALPVKTCAGLYYQVAWGSDLGNMVSGEKVQASGDLLYLGVIKQTGEKGFYRLSVSEK